MTPTCDTRGREREAVVPVKRKDLFKLLGLNDPLDMVDPTEVWRPVVWVVDPAQTRRAMLQHLSHPHLPRSLTPRRLRCRTSCYLRIKRYKLA